MTAREAGYLRALRFGWLTRFYDPLIRLGLREDAEGGMMKAARSMATHRLI